MEKFKVTDRITELEKLIKHHKALYYQGSPEIPDHEYDNLEDELRSIDPENKALELVGSEVKTSQKVKHDLKMLSLNKTYKEADLISWANGEDIVSTYKIDGVSCSLIYEAGILTLAKTRGDGTYGENITNKILWVSNIPSHVNTSAEKMEIRGEIFCSEDDFFHLSDEMVKRNLPRPSNQRNIVAGLMGRKDFLDLSRYLTFYAFDLISNEINFDTEMEKSHLMKQMGFDIPVVVLHTNIKSVRDRINEARHFMAEGDYLIDGLVFSYNKVSLHNELGETAHHPRYKIAYKFQGESKQTHIKKIIWSVSRNGILTPVAIVDPIELSGARISRVTLHNYGMVRQFNLKKGDKIEIIRSGEVIPKFLSVVEESSEEFTFPSKCPICSAKVIINDIRLFCSNDSCPGRQRESILNFIQKIGIEDLSSKRLLEMINKGLVAGVEDLYRLSQEDFLKLDKIKEKMAAKLYSNISKSKQVDLITFLSALGIQGGAYNKCEKIVQAGFDTIDSILNLDIQTLSHVDGFAEKSATEFIKSLKEKHALINTLLQYGFNFDKVKTVQTAITGRKICITGALSEKRSIIETRIRDHGGVVVSSVTKNTDILLTNDKDSGSSKSKKAKQLGIQILNENDLIKLLK